MQQIIGRDEERFDRPWSNGRCVLRRKALPTLMGCIPSCCRVPWVATRNSACSAASIRFAGLRFDRRAQLGETQDECRCLCRSTPLLKRLAGASSTFGHPPSWQKSSYNGSNAPASQGSAVWRVRVRRKTRSVPLESVRDDGNMFIRQAPVKRARASPLAATHGAYPHEAADPKDVDSLSRSALRTTFQSHTCWNSIFVFGAARRAAVRPVAMRWSQRGKSVRRSCYDVALSAVGFFPPVYF